MVRSRTKEEIDELFDDEGYLLQPFQATIDLGITANVSLLSAPHDALSLTFAARNVTYVRNQRKVLARCAKWSSSSLNRLIDLPSD